MSTAQIDPAAVAQVRRDAQRVRSLIRSREFDLTNIEVQPVLVLWGPGAPEAAPSEINGVYVFTNRTLQELRSWLNTPRLDRKLAASIAERLTAYSTGQDHSVPLTRQRGQAPKSG